MAGEKILIVDDDQDLVLGLSVWLHAQGYKVVTAVDSITGLGAARREEPQLIILDIGLPGEDGFLFLTRLKAMTQLPPIPVIVLTAKGADLRQQALRAGASAFFQKPVDNYELLFTMTDLLAKHDDGAKAP